MKRLMVGFALALCGEARAEEDGELDLSAAWEGESRVLGLSAGIGPRYGVTPGVAATLRPVPFLGLLAGGGTHGPTFQGRLYPRGLPVYVQVGYGPLLSDELQTAPDASGRYRTEPIAYKGPSAGVGVELNRGWLLIDVGAGYGEADLGLLDEDVFTLDAGIGVNLGDRAKLRGE